MSALKQIQQENKELVAYLSDVQLQDALARAQQQIDYTQDATTRFLAALAYERLAIERERRTKPKRRTKEVMPSGRS